MLVVHPARRFCRRIRYEITKIRYELRAITPFYLFRWRFLQPLPGHRKHASSRIAAASLALMISVGAVGAVVYAFRGPARCDDTGILNCSGTYHRPQSPGEDGVRALPGW